MTLKFHAALLMLVVCIASCQTVSEKEEPVNLLPATGLGINGVTILVQDLDSARNYYASKLGFSMPGKFDNGLYNGTLSAYLSFADFSSLELIGINDSEQKKPIPVSLQKILLLPRKSLPRKRTIQAGQEKILPGISKAGDQQHLILIFHQKKPILQKLILLSPLL